MTPSSRWWRLEFPAGTTPCQVRTEPYRGGPCAYLSAASVRFFTPSFEKRCCTWNFTVLSDRPSRSAICGLVSPPATSAQTSRSRGVRSPGALARPSIQRRAACGNTSWPACTCRIAVNVCWGDSVFNARPCTGVERRAERLAVVVGGEHENFRGCRPVAQRGDDLRPLDARELEVQDDDVGLVLLDELDDLRAVGGPGRDFDVGFAVEQRAQAFDHDRVVVGEQHADHGPRLIRRAARR